jgi:hypothetical protein
MRKNLFFCVFLLVLIILTACSADNTKTSVSKVKTSERYESIDSLYNSSQYIVKGTVGKKIKDIEYGGVDFTITEINVNESIKGTTNSKISLLQTVTDLDPTVITKSNVLLFLEKYNGPIYENAYVCKGLGQGQFIIKDNNRVESSIKLNESMNNDITSKKDLIKYLKDK